MNCKTMQNQGCDFCRNFTMECLRAKEEYSRVNNLAVQGIGGQHAAFRAWEKVVQLETKFWEHLGETINEQTV